MVLPLDSVEDIDWTPTTISLEESGAKGKVKLLGVNREASYPPNIRLPYTFLRPGAVVSNKVPHHKQASTLLYGFPAV